MNQTIGQAAICACVVVAVTTVDGAADAERVFASTVDATPICAFGSEVAGASDEDALAHNAWLASLDDGLDIEDTDDNMIPVEWVPGFGLVRKNG